VVATIVVPAWFQGPTGCGQGGWTAGKVAEAVGTPVTVRLRAPVPLEAGLVVTGSAEAGWRVRHGDHVVLEAQRWDPDPPPGRAVPLGAARLARSRFPVAPEDHPVPHCFSCGLQPDGMQVHAGPLGEAPERFATDWTAPAWAARTDGTVDPAALWAALDCTAAWYVCCYPAYRPAVTAQYAVQVARPVTVGERLALVAGHGDRPAGWDGRKREAVSWAFDEAGRTVAAARSLWVAQPGDG
jgi:hypothetical protein